MTHSGQGAAALPVSPRFAPHILDLWGKTDPEAPERYHPLAYHLMDVAAGAEALWTHVLPPATRDLYCSLLQAEPGVAQGWLSFLAGLHDLGKATPGFQAQVAPQRQRLRARGWKLPVGAARAHDALGLMLLTRALTSAYAPQPVPRPLGGAAALDVATVVAAHHGAPAAPRPALDCQRHMGDAAWEAARVELLALLAEVSGLPVGPVPPGLLHPSRALLSLLGGLIRVADWTASQQQDCVEAQDERAYAEMARERAVDRALSASWGGRSASLVVPGGACRDDEFESVFGFTPNALQQQVATLAGPVQAPAMVMIEAPTGTGKTEAALDLARRWLGHGRHSGIYFALPTQASAAAMQERLAAYPGFAAAVQGSGQPCLDSALQEAGAAAGSGPAAARLLGRLGVGTVDQALLAVVSDRQAWVRLLGLANKIVILDEVHAYDTYTSGLLQRLLEWLAALNCSVILLSATLPVAQRAELLRAYGALEAPPPPPGPSVTLATSTYQEVAPVRVERQRRVRVRHAERKRLVRELTERVREGGCAAVVCNTVGAAQATYARLRVAARREGIELSLLHGRLPQAWREERERRLIRQCGPGATRPQRAIVVGTQVIEQSLDLDFDLVVTELAPVDAVVQRLGRLHRHDRARPEGLQEPEAWLLCPETGEDGLPDFGAAAAVYEEAVLLRSWQLLHDREALDLPADVPGLVAGCYAPASEEAWPEPLAGRVAAAARQEAVRQQVEAFAAARAAEGSPHAAGLGLSQGAAPTRLESGRTVRVVCLHAGAPGVRLCGTDLILSEPPAPWEVGEMVRHAVHCRHRELVDALARQGRPESWRAQPALQGLVPLWLDGRQQTRLNGVMVRLDRDLGLVVRPHRSQERGP